MERGPATEAVRTQRRKQEKSKKVKNIPEIPGQSKTPIYDSEQKLKNKKSFCVPREHNVLAAHISLTAVCMKNLKLMPQRSLYSLN